MPIPILAQEAEEFAPATEAKILQFPVSSALSAAKVENERFMLRDRTLAHLVDAVLVHGFSIYVAKVLAFLLALQFTGDVRALGVDKAPEAFQALVAFATLRVWLVCFAVFSCLYTTLSTHYFGRTFGKALFRLRVVDADGRTPSMRQSFLRYLGYGFTYASFGLTYLLSYLNGEKRIVHDRISGTEVVRV